MNNQSQIFSNRLKSARVLNGLSLQDLADKLKAINKKMSKQALHKYEKGEVLPDSEMIGLLANVLKVRPEFFFREQNVELGEINFRKHKSLPVKEENRVKEFTRDVLSRYLELEEIIGIQKPFENPISNFPPVTNFLQVDEAAQKVREKWNLGTDPIYNLLELLEDNNIKVIDAPMEDGFDGLQTNVNGTVPVIVYNSSKIKSPDRIRFTVMHELGHMLLSIPDELPENAKEKICHQFAGAMLFPKEAALKELGKTRHRLFIQELMHLKEQYGISVQALIMRLSDLCIIKDNYRRQFFFFINQMGWKVEEPGEYKGEEKSNRFEQLLYRALAEDLISISKAAGLMNLKVSEFKAKSLMIG